MSKYSEKAIALEVQIFELDYYTSLYETVLGDRQLSLLTDAEISLVMNQFWGDLPDNAAIRRRPFFDLCDLCVELEEEYYDDEPGYDSDEQPF
jgi:hypothetical protein